LGVRREKRHSIFGKGEVCERGTDRGGSEPVRAKQIFDENGWGGMSWRGWENRFSKSVMQITPGNSRNHRGG